MNEVTAQGLDELWDNSIIVTSRTETVSHHTPSTIAPRKVTGRILPPPASIHLGNESGSNPARIAAVNCFLYCKYSNYCSINNINIINSFT